MSTVIRAEIAKSNKYWISKHRYHELRHFCLQYPEWKRICKELSEYGIPISSPTRVSQTNTINDPTARIAITNSYYSKRMKLIEDTAKLADKCLYEYIIKGVTEGRSYVYLKSRLDIPCSRDLYYDRYRRFFWLLDKER